MSQVKENVRIRFSKQGDVRFISHHDLMRVFERALRRAELPFAASEGYNPRPRLSFPIPLSVGHTGHSEVVDVGLREWIRPDKVRHQLQAELPEGIGIVSVEIMRLNPNRRPRELAYRIPLLPSHSLAHEEVRSVLESESVLVQRVRHGKAKSVEVRRFIKAIRLDGGSVRMLLRFTDEGTARPEEVMHALGCRPGLDYRKSAIERTNVNLAPLR